MSENEEIIQIRVPLRGEMLKRFLFLKKRYGFESNTDLIRLLITEKYEEIKKEGMFEK